MQLSADEISQIIKSQIQNFDSATVVKETGTVLSTGDGIARLYGLEGEVNGAPARIGEAAIVREGRHVTLVSAMRGVHECLAAAERLAADGIDAEVVDLRTLRPLDGDTILASLEKTTRVVVVEEGPLTGGWGGEVLAVVAERGLGDVDDMWRITTPDTPVPYSPPLEDAHLPGADRIVAEVSRRLG